MCLIGLSANVLALLMLQPGWHLIAGQCLPPGDFGSMGECCVWEHYFPRQISEQCLQETNEFHTFIPGQYMICYINCVFRAMGVVTENGEALPERFLPYIATLGDSLRPLLTNATVICAKDSETMKNDAQTFRSACDVFPFLFLTCQSRIVAYNCPIELWNISPTCQEVKKGIRPC